MKRLAPVSLAVVLLSVLLSSRYWSGMAASDAAAGIFGYTNWHVVLSGEDALLRTIVGPLGPYWSLAVEEQFYVVMTAAVMLAWRTASPVRTLSIVVVVGWVGSLAVQIFTTGPQYRLEFGTDSRGAELLAGCGLALLLHRRADLPQRMRSALAIAGPLAFAVVAVLVATTDYDPPWLLRGGYAGLSLVSAVLVASLLIDCPLSRFLATTPTVVVGRLSYSWYVVHWPVVLIVDAELDGFDRWPLVAAKVAASFVAAVVLHLTIEQPLRRVESGVRAVTTAWIAASGIVLVTALVVL